MRPALKRSLHPLWRDPSTLQLGVDPDVAVVVAGVDARTAALLALLDGRRDQDAVIRAAAAAGVPSAHAGQLISALAAAGVLEDAGAADRPALRRPPATVRVVGCGQVGSSVARLLAAAHIGRIEPADDVRVTWADLSPWGLGADDIGRPRAAAVRDHLRRSGVRTAGPPGGSDPDVDVLADGTANDPAQWRPLLDVGTPHLAVDLRDGTALIGPLVLPRSTSCLHCLALHRADRDPAWPRLTAQLRTAPPAAAADVVLAAFAAVLTTLEALAFVDAGGDPCRPPPGTANGTLELRPPDWRLRRRTRSPHPDCPCQSR